MQEEGLKTRRIRLRMVVELEVRADADTDEVMDHIERLDDLAKKALESEPIVRQMTQFRITRTE
jgi:hypothetical protein